MKIMKTMKLTLKTRVVLSLCFGLACHFIDYAPRPAIAHASVTERRNP